MQNMIFSRISFIIFILSVLKLSNECILLSKTYHTKYNIILIKDFNSFNELNFTCAKTINLSFLEIKPNIKLILDNQLNLGEISIEPVKQDVFAVMFNNFKGFSIEFNPFRQVKFINFDLRQIVWNFKQSNFDFYFNNTLINDYCNETLFDKIKNVNNILTSCQAVALDQSVKFSTRMCPLSFRNAYMNILTAYVSSSLINKNELAFQQAPSNVNFKLSSVIFQLQLQMYHYNLTSLLLDKNVFKRMKILDLGGQINSIQSDLFKQFESIRVIRIRTQSARNVFSRNNKWLSYLNWNQPNATSTKFEFNAYNSLILVVYQTFENLTFYDYPEEDFCLFKHFPHHKNVFPNLKPNTQSSCSCTELFLIQNAYKYAKYLEYYTGRSSNLISNYYQYQYYFNSPSILNNNIPFSKCVNMLIETNIQKCNFELKLAKCKIEIVAKNEKNFYFYLSDWYALSQYSKQMLSFYITPINCFISLFINFFIILVLSNKRIFTKEFDHLYSYLKMNAYFNLVYILIIVLKIIRNCDNDSLFCWSNLDVNFVRYFNIFVIKLLGNSTQTAANISHLAFTLSRYITISRKEFCILNKFKQLALKKFFALTFLFSLLVNSYVCFEFNYDENSYASYSHELYILKNFNSFKENYSKLELTMLNLFQYLKIFTADLVYILFSFLIDLLLIFYVRKKMNIKKSIARVLPAISLALKEMKSDRMNGKKVDANTSSYRLTGMIIFNGINFIVFRLPLSLVSIYGLVFYYEVHESVHYSLKKVVFKPSVSTYIVCRGYGFCETLEDFFHLVYLNSFIVQFWILYRFDKKFHASFRQLTIFRKIKT